MFSHDHFDTFRRVEIRVISASGVGDRFTPRIKVQLAIDYKPQESGNVQGQLSQLTILEHRLEITAGGFVIGIAGPKYDIVRPNYSASVDYEVAVARNVLESLELVRRDDLPVSFNLGGICVETRQVPGVQPQRSWSFSISTTKDFSQAQWTKLLRELGFRDTWIVELPKPQIPQVAGLEKAQKFLADAETEITQGSPENAVTHCRKAMDVLEPFLDQNWKQISEEIDRESIVESKKPTKSERIANIRDSIKVWCNIGPHADKYSVSLEDARLCYRLTVILFSYVLRIASRP